MKTDLINIKNNKLYIGEFSFVELATKFKTPLYVYDEKQILNKIKMYNNVLYDDILKDKNNNVDFKVVYASKAFIAPRLCKILNEQNCYIDAVSCGDLYLINKSNFPMEHVVLHGNNKSVEDLEMALDLNVGYIVCDNYSELQLLEKICKQKNKKVNTLFRVNPGVEAHTHSYIQTSMLDSKFGESIYDEKRIEDIINFYKKSQYLVLEGFHAHIGSQINSSDSFTALVHVITEFVKKIRTKYDFNISTLDFGGGFAIKYLDDDIEIDIPKTIKAMVKTCLDDLKDTDIKIKNIMVEPGRSIVGDAGFTLYTCGGTKKTFAGVEYVFIDGGMTDNIRPALYEAKYTIDNASCVSSSKKKVYNVAGKCCESGDMIAKNVSLSEVTTGDILVCYSTGAYCYSMSMNYNGLTRGAVIFVNEKEAYEVIKRESCEDITKNNVF